MAQRHRRVERHLGRQHGTGDTTAGVVPSLRQEEPNTSQHSDSLLANTTTWNGEYKRETSSTLSTSCICVPDTTRSTESKGSFKLAMYCYPSTHAYKHGDLTVPSPVRFSSLHSKESLILTRTPSSSSSSTANMSIISSPKPSFLPSPVSTRDDSNVSTALHRVYTDMLPRIWNGVIAILIATVAQLLIAGIERLLGSSSAEFPASILAMAVVFCSIWTSGLLVSGVDQFYERHLKCAADLLNRHMSVGFTIPFIMICRSPVADAGTIGLIIGCFVLTGFVNSILAYFLALPIQSLVVRWDARVWDCSSSGEETQDRSRSKVFRLSANSCDSEFVEASLPDCSVDETATVESPSQEVQSWSTSLFILSLQNPLLLIFWLLTITVGIPMRYTTGDDTALSICLLFAVWFSSLAIQGAIKTSQRLRPCVQTLLFGLFNAVLWTSLAMIGYAFANAAISNRSIHDILGDLQTNSPLSRRIAHLGTSATDAPMAAGDVALTILNAGLVAWGLKLYEYRRQLLSRAGLTVFLVSSLLALGNMVLGPLLVHRVGLRPASSDLAFAARSVTIALASPVMAILKGDDGLNAAMVVISGILYQMALGFGVGAWLEKQLTWGSWEQQPSTSPEITTGIAGTARRDIEAQTDGRTGRSTATSVHDPRTVAAGVTIGINSAAMGTAYLYETKSDAAPYSALSMIALGIMTVGCSAIKPLIGWIVQQVAA